MSTTDPIAPPPKNNAKKWLVGCLVVLLLLVIGGLAVLVLGVYAAKKQVDSMAGDARNLYEDASRAAKALESAPRLAPELMQAAEARMRLSRAASAAYKAQSLQPEACSDEPPRAAPPVDAEFLQALVGGLPTEAMGTPWFRHEVFATAAAAAVPLDTSGLKDTQAPALIALDRALGEAGSIAIIHTTKLEEPTDTTEGRFEGSVQLIGYPDGETICSAPFEASGPAAEFQQKFRAAQEAALGK